MNPSNQLRPTTQIFLIALLIGSLTLSADGQGLNPPPDGGYPGANTAEGQNALFSLGSGGYNTALGWSSLRSNTTGNFNTGVGAGTLLFNTSNQNTATGAGALLSNTTGFRNTATGAFALLNNLGAADNTATGNAALLTNTTGSGNTATGNFALVSNEAGSNNTATGNGALSGNTSGTDNVAIGASALGSNTDSSKNTAIGSRALAASTGFSGNGNNTAVGWSALASNTSGIGNTAIGLLASLGNTTGSDNVALGDFAGSQLTTGNGNIEIGNPGEAGEANTTRLGAFQTRTFIAGIYNVTTGGPAIPVVIDGSGQLGTFSSSRRFKKEIKAMENASESVLELKPVTFRYKNDANGIAQFGLIAEEVAEVNPHLVVRDKQGEVLTVRYDAVNAMLLNEFLKEHRKVQELEANDVEQQNAIKALTVMVKEQASQLQKVSAQLQLSKFATETAMNDQ